MDVALVGPRRQHTFGVTGADAHDRDRPLAQP
jgi:hypothetical protein